MAPILGRVAWDHHFVPEPGRDLVVASGAAVRLDRLVRMHVAHLDRTFGHLGAMHHRNASLVAQPNTAHSTRAATTASAATTITTSLARLVWERNGLRPTPLR